MILNHLASIYCNLILQEIFQNDAPPFFDLEERIYWDERNSTFSCVQNSLKKVTMDGFSGRNNEMKLIQFLLKKARVLRKMEIISISTAEVMEKIQYLSETLSYFPRASPLASIEFCWSPSTVEHVMFYKNFLVSLRLFLRLGKISIRVPSCGDLEIFTDSIHPTLYFRYYYVSINHQLSFIA